MKTFIFAVYSIVVRYVIAIYKYLLLFLFCIYFIKVNASEKVNANPRSIPVYFSKPEQQGNKTTRSDHGALIKQPVEVLINQIVEFESGLNTYHPESSTIQPQVTGVGAVSVGFELNKLHGLHIRRYPGFSDYTTAAQYADNVERYRTLLHRIGIKTTDTRVIATEGVTGYGVVYIIQPFLKTAQRPEIHVKEKGDVFTRRLVKKQLKWLESMILHNQSNDDYHISIDLHMNNIELVELEDDFDIRFNDFTPLLMKYKGEFVHDFHDMAFSVLSPISWLFIQPGYIKAFSNTFNPTVIATHLLYGHEVYQWQWPWQALSNWWYNSHGPIEYPQWVLNEANELLTSYNLPPIIESDVKEYLDQLFLAHTCINKLQSMSRVIRHYGWLNSDVYMSPGEATAQRLGNKDEAGFFNCLQFAFFKSFNSLH